MKHHALGYVATTSDGLASLASHPIISSARPTHEGESGGACLNDRPLILVSTGTPRKQTATRCLFLCSGMTLCPCVTVVASHVVLTSSLLAPLNSLSPRGRAPSPPEAASSSQLTVVAPGTPLCVCGALSRVSLLHLSLFGDRSRHGCMITTSRPDLREPLTMIRSFC